MVRFVARKLLIWALKSAGCHEHLLPAGRVGAGAQLEAAELWVRPAGKSGEGLKSLYVINRQIGATSLAP